MDSLKYGSQVIEKLEPKLAYYIVVLVGGGGGILRQFCQHNIQI